jgi:hypothetical protein
MAITTSSSAVTTIATIAQSPKPAG